MCGISSPLMFNKLLVMLYIYLSLLGYSKIEKHNMLNLFEVDICCDYSLLLKTLVTYFEMLFSSVYFAVNIY